MLALLALLALLKKCANFQEHVHIDLRPLARLIRPYEGRHNSTLLDSTSFSTHHVLAYFLFLIHVSEEVTVSMRLNSDYLRLFLADFVVSAQLEYFWNMAFHFFTIKLGCSASVFTWSSWFFRNLSIPLSKTTSTLYFLQSRPVQYRPLKNTVDTIPIT